MPVRQIYEPNLNIGAQSGWCLQYVDDAISSLTRSPNAQTAYLNELNAGRINTGPAPVGIWVIGFLGFSRGIYVDDGHVFLMRKRADGSIEIHDSEVHSGARGIYNSIEELMNWMGNYGPDYLGYSYCCDGRRIAEDYDETQPTDRKMEEDGNARDEANTNSAIFQELEKGDVIAMKGYITNGQAVAGDTVWYVTARSGKYMSRQLFEDKDLHDLPDLTPKTEAKPEAQPEPQEDYSKIILDISNHQDDAIVNHLHRFAGVIIKAGHVGQSYGGDANKIDPKLVKFSKAAGDKLLGIYWLPYFSTDEEAKTEAERFVEAQKLVNAPLLFVDLEPDFEGTLEQLKLFKNLVLQKTGKQVFTYAGEAIIQKLGLDRVDWYPNYGTKDNYAHGSFIHQYTESGKVDGFNLDFSTSKISIDELKAMGKPQLFEKSETKPEIKPESEVKTEKPQEVPNNKSEEEKMATPALTKEDIEAIEKVTAEKANLVQGLAETDEAQEIIKGISKRTKLVVYIVGDLLLGASAIAPQVAIAVLSGDPYVKINAISGALATAGLFLLTMFGIYKNGKNK